MRKNIRTLVASAAILASAGGVSAVAATAASAASAAPAVTMAAHVSQARLSGPNVLSLTFNGHTYNYNIRTATIPVSRNLSLVAGSLRDSYEPQPVNLPIQGVIFGNDVVLSVQYPTTGPDAGPQGVRTFSGTIGAHGHVSGTWNETGSENGSGTFSLLFPAR